MLRFARNRRAQTAVEMLFILGVVLIGIVAIIPAYTSESNDSVTIATIRDAASRASTYIETGVEIDGNIYTALNQIMNEYTNHSPVGFKFVGLKTQEETDDSVKILLKFEHDLNLNKASNKAIAEEIGQFLMEYLNLNDRFSLRDGELYANGKEIILNVTVNNEWAVVP